MKLSTNGFESNIYNTTKKGNNLHGFYQFHNVDVYTTLTISENDKTETFTLVYQTGMTFDYNDADFPRNDLELSEDAGTPELIMNISNLSESHFDDAEIIQEFLDDINHPIVNTSEKLWQLYAFISELKPHINDFASDKPYEIDNIYFSKFSELVKFVWNTYKIDFTIENDEQYTDENGCLQLDIIPENEKKSAIYELRQQIENDKLSI